MKKRFSVFISAFLLISVFSSCGQSQVCKCVELNTQMMKELGEAGVDADQIRQIQEKYAGDIETCGKLGEGKSEAELQEMFKEMERCK